MLDVVAPVLHKYESPPVAVNNVLSPSFKTTSSPALAVGISLTKTTTSSVSELFSAALKTSTE